MSVNPLLSDLSAEKARKLLNWDPSFALDQGLTKTIAWYREFFTAGNV